ncbi:MAG: hypothetical protein H6Q60_687 [Oscillospiraceae bacterium]|nr:hypothetical protein [Oscillospiraceae bacterium]
MITFSVYRWSDSLWINGTSRYRSGEILCDYLNLDAPKLEIYYNLLKNSSERLRYTDDSGSQQFNQDAQTIQKILNYLDDILFGLKPFQGNEHLRTRRLFVLLNKYDELFFDDRFVQFGTVPEEMPLLTRFEPASRPDQVAEQVAAMSREIRELLRVYIGFCEDVLRVKYVFSDFLDHYFHVHSTFPTSTQAADAYQRFSEAHPPSSSQTRYQTFVPYFQLSSTFGTLTIQPEHGEQQTMLCEVNRYSDLGAFLTVELFLGIQTGQLPKRCGCCGRYFLLSNGYYPDFCENLAPGETEKACREVGAKKKHERKVKNDPVWLAHQRAYKTHYARYMKKKITSTQFKSWSKFACKLRDQMLAEATLPHEKRTMTQADYEILLKE